MPSVEFGYKADADRYREESPEYICPDDDARLKTVTFTSDAPEWLLDQARLDTDEGRAEREASAGQATLSDHERDEIDFSKGRANIPHARAVKGIAADHGVDDWLAYYDPTLTVDEHRDVMERAGQAGGGRRMDADEGRQAARARDAARAAKSSECDHASDHCEHGDPDACEFLQNACGYTEDEVAAILNDQEASGDEEVTGKAAGALGRAWGGYKGAITRLDREIDDVVESKREAERAAAAINAIRRDHGQDPMEFERLEGLSDRVEEVGSTAHDAEGHVELMERFS